MLKENDLVKVHLYGCSNKEIKTRNYNKVFRVYSKNGVLGIDWNTSRSPYTNHGDIFTPFRCFASCVEFEKVETGEKFHFDSIADQIIKIA